MVDISTSSEHARFRDDVEKLVKKHGQSVHPIEMLQMASFMVGELIAVQDSVVSTEVYMEIVQTEIKKGAQSVINKFTEDGADNGKEG